VVATDGSLWLIRPSTQEPARGVEVMWHSVGIQHRSDRVGGQHSSTRAELVAVVMAPATRNPSRRTPRADDLAILIDSAAAVRERRRRLASYYESPLVPGWGSSNP